MSTLVAIDESAQMISVASMPSIFGMRTSISATSAFGDRPKGVPLGHLDASAPSDLDRPKRGHAVVC